MKHHTDIVQLLEQYRSYALEKAIDFDRFNRYALTYHSTRLEGSTLTEIETQVLLSEGTTPKGKPLMHSLMVQDHFNALAFVIDTSKAKKPVSVPLVQQINALTMKHTGSTNRTALGDVDASTGAFRKGNASVGSRYFVNYDKVGQMTTRLVEKLQGDLRGKKTLPAILETSFKAHFDLVSIHPFYDGNGRTSRLLMNYIQSLFQLPLARVFSEDRATYIQVLEDTRNKKDMGIFVGFMYDQYYKLLVQEIRKYQDILRAAEKGAWYPLIFLAILLLQTILPQILQER
jgi:Fic family protein